MRRHGKTFSVRLTDKQDRKLEQLALLSCRTKQSVLRVLIEHANLRDVTRVMLEDAK